GGGELVELLFFELLNKVHRNLHRRRAQPSGGCAIVHPARVRVGGSYKASKAACHPFVVSFGRFCLMWVAQRSGRRDWVSASDSVRRQAATLAWSPEMRISGMDLPSKTCGRVYWGYSSSPSEKLSSAPDASFPITPGSSRTQASIRAIAAISPPDKT